MSLKRTALYEQHVACNGKLVDFAGWELPINYGSQIQEHQAIRGGVGMFDVSHMCCVDISGKDVEDFLGYALANDINKLVSNGQALYSCMLNENAGIVDDLIVYRLSSDLYRLVVNAATSASDITWLKSLSRNYSISIKPRTDLAIIAVQGPQSVGVVAKLLEQEQLMYLPKFNCMEVSDNFWIARTGYTGEDGFEVMLPNEQASAFWQALLDLDVIPCGLGARDSLRLEAGLNLYGQDMDENTTPYAANLGWTVSNVENRDFIGKSSLIESKASNNKKLIGLVLKEKGMLRAGYTVYCGDDEVGTLTSGGFSPTAGKAIGFARVNNSAKDNFTIGVRNKKLPAQQVKLPFIKNNMPTFEIEKVKEQL